MPIAIDLIGSNLKVRILSSPFFNEDREKLKKVWAKKPIYKIENGKDKFQHWEIAKDSLGQILEKFTQQEIIPESKKAEAYLDSFYQINRTDLKDIHDPIEFKRVPKTFQEAYIRLPKEKKNLISAFGCGCGKTLVALERARILGFKTILIVIPTKNLFQNWKTEIYETWNRSDITIYHGTKQKREKLLREPLSPIVLTTYTMVGELDHLKFDQIILDEAHILAHPETRTFKNTIKLIKNNREAGIQLLTATPIQDRPVDLWALVHILYPELAGSYWAWKSRYLEVIKSIQKTIPMKTGGFKIIQIPLITRTRNLDELHNKLKPFMIRVKREDYTSFEDCIDIVNIEMNVRQAQLYHKAKQSLLLELEQTGAKLDLSNILARLTRLLQIAQGNFNLEPGRLESGHLDYICDQIDLASDKLIVWSRFKPITEILYEKYKKKAVLFNGDLTQKERNASIWSFQGVKTQQDLNEFNKLNSPFKPGEAQLFFGTIDRNASLGFNLDACYRQIFSSFPFSSTQLEQAASRIKRISQTADQIYTTFLVSDGTIEAKCLNMVLDKIKTNSRIVDGKEDLSYNRIQELLRVLKS